MELAYHKGDILYNPNHRDTGKYRVSMVNGAKNKIYLRDLQYGLLLKMRIDDVVESGYIIKGEA